MNENEAKLTVWILTLPGWSGAQPEDDLERNYLNPDIWPGDWKHFLHANTMVVAAISAQDARDFAAREDCAIWLDPLYAQCRPMVAREAGVVFMIRAGADNE